MSFWVLVTREGWHRILLSGVVKRLVLPSSQPFCLNFECTTSPIKAFIYFVVLLFIQMKRISWKPEPVFVNSWLYGILSLAVQANEFIFLQSTQYCLIPFTQRGRPNSSHGLRHHFLSVEKHGEDAPLCVVQRHKVQT